MRSAETAAGVHSEGASGAVRTISCSRSWGGRRSAGAPKPLLSVAVGCGVSLNRTAASRRDRRLEGKKDRQIKGLFSRLGGVGSAPRADVRWLIGC